MPLLTFIPHPASLQKSIFLVMQVKKKLPAAEISSAIAIRLVTIKFTLTALQHSF